MLICFVGGVGPWPLDTTPEEEPEVEALKIVAREAEGMQLWHEARPATPLYAGWGASEMELPAGVPLAGYGARRGAASSGTKAGESLKARTFVLRCGPLSQDVTVAIVCIDALLIHPRIIEGDRNGAVGKAEF